MQMKGNTILITGGGPVDTLKRAISSARTTSRLPAGT
jgi:short-subunit dehydrogenase involved in D-alanine esterification of teichoic acids